ncbi:TonB-dependent receptor [Janthinobacterium violaceinigrum]|nr:TonB-dependent receptor [Janthinobacterium violaceinigrum]
MSATLPRKLTLCLLLSSPAFAVAQTADSPAPADAGLPSVLVSASKAGRTVMETPASVSVIKGDAIEQAHLETLGDVAQQLPNVYLTNFTRSTPSLTIRGLGFSDDESDSTSTSVLLDGVPMYSLVLGQLFDLQQLEVLRGPQSTLYGQSSMGGVVALRSRDPGQVLGGSAQVDYGSGKRRRASLAMDVPLGEKTAVRIVAGGEKADGFIDNTRLQRSDTGGWDSAFARIKLLHRDDMGGTWRFGLHHANLRGGNDYFADASLAREHRSTASDAGVNNVKYTLLSGEYERALAHGTRLAVTMGANRTEWNYWLPRSTFQARSGYDMKNEQVSLEARLSGAAGAYDWLAGAYGSHITRDSPYLFDSSPYYLSATTAGVKGGTVAAFGELGWRVSHTWRVAGALRLEHDTRKLDWSSRQAGLFDSNGDGMPDAPFDATTVRNGNKVSDTVALPRLTVEYRPDAAQFGWLTVARGYKASGFNLYATAPDAASTAYRPEYGTHGEIGYRLRGAQRAWDLAATVFYTRLRDQQVTVTDTNGQSRIDNAGRSHSQGLELTGTVRPLPTLELTAFAGIVHAEYDDYVKGGVDFAGKQFANTPRHSVGMGLHWQPTPQWDAGLDATRQGASNLYPASSTVNPAYTLVNAHLSYRVQRWTFGLYGKNLGDAQYYTRALANNIVVASQPRTWGVRAGLDF